MANGRSSPVAIDQGGEGYLVVVAPFAGEAEEHKAAYALVVPRQPPVTFTYLASQLLATESEDAAVVAQLAPIGGGLLLALIIGFLLMRLEAVGPAKRLARESQSLARGDDLATRRRSAPRAVRHGGARDQHHARSVGLVAAGDSDTAT